MTKRGTDLERVINLIQKAIEPDAIVEHDIFLPVTGSASGRTRQCDTVITSGPKHRKTITIVEVQDRSSKVNINTFKGKLDEVGAQHLICVSRLDFPKSIKEKAHSLGNKVKLITLKNANPNEIPRSFFKSSIKYSYFHFGKLSSPKLDILPEEATSQDFYDSIYSFLKKNFKSNDKIFSLDKRNLMSLNNLCQNTCENLDVNGTGNNILEFSRNEGQPLFLFYEGHYIRIGLKIEFTWINDVQLIPFSILSYEQQGDGSLAWMFEGKLDTINGPVSVKIPFIKEDDHFKIPGVITNHQNYSIQITKDPEQE